MLLSFNKIENQLPSTFNHCFYESIIKTILNEWYTIKGNWNEQRSEYMHFYCTKKLMKALTDAEKILNTTHNTISLNETEDSTEVQDSFFTWHGNLFKLEEMDCIVLTNDATGFTLIFQDPYEEDYLEIGDLISEALSRMMKRMGFSDQSIIDYFKAFGDYTVSRASNQKLMGKNNASGQFIGIYEEFLNEDDCFQDAWSYKVSEMKKGEDGSLNTVQAFINQFKEKIGDYFVEVDIAELEIRLKLEGSKDVVRILEVPMNINFDELHGIIQTVFMWQNAHMHQFILEDGYTLVGSEGYQQMLQYKVQVDEQTDSGNHYLLSDIITTEENKFFSYVYDFGDYWEHTIQVRNIWTENKQVGPKLKMMMGDPVPEDVGGAGGYAYYLDVMKDTNHPEYGSLKSWASEFEFNKVHLNTVDAINIRLQSK